MPVLFLSFLLLGQFGAGSLFAILLVEVSLVLGSVLFSIGVGPFLGGLAGVGPFFYWGRS